MAQTKKYSTIINKLEGGDKIQIAVVNNEAKPESGAYTVFSWSGTEQEEKDLKVLKTVRAVAKDYNTFRRITQDFPVLRF